MVERGDDLPYIVEVMIQTEKKNAEANKAVFFDYLQNGITLPMAGDGTTMIGHTVQEDAVFGDLGEQHPNFLNVINNLVKYKILIANRANFEGDMPLTWGDVVKVYLKGVMAVNMDAAAESCGYPVKYSCLFDTQMIEVAGEQVPVSKMIADLEIDVDAYAANELLYRFDLIARLYFAGIKNVPFTQWALDTFEYYGDHLYPTEKQQLQDREFTMFGKRRVQLGEAVQVDYRRSPTSIYRHPSKGIMSTQGTSQQKIVFNKDFPRYEDFIGNLVLRLCGSNLQCYARESAKGYGVVTLGELVNYIFPLMDRSKFIPELEEKKDEGYGGYFG